MKKYEVINNVIERLNNPIIIERGEMLERFIFEMWQQLGSPKNITPIDLYYAFIDANIGYKMMNNTFDKNYFITK